MLAAVLALPLPALANSDGSVVLCVNSGTQKASLPFKYSIRSILATQQPQVALNVAPWGSFQIAEAGTGGLIAAGYVGAQNPLYISHEQLGVSAVVNTPINSPVLTVTAKNGPVCVTVTGE